MGGVNISFSNGELGAVLATDDGVFGMVLTGFSEGSYVSGVPVLVTGMADVAILGITAVGNAFGFRQLQDFYRVAPVGTKLYLLLVSDALLVSNMADKDNVNGGAKLVDFAAGKIKVLGMMQNNLLVDYTTDGTGINPECLTASDNMEVMVNHYRGLAMPFRGIIGGTGYDGTASELPDMTDGTSNNTCAILVGDIQSGQDACLGLLMGILAGLPVQRKVSRVKNGSLPGVTAAYLGTSTVEASGGAAGVIADRGYITFKKYPRASGYFFSGDPMVTATTDDYKYLARGRVIDKAFALAYAYGLQLVDDEVPVVPKKVNDVVVSAPEPKWAANQEAQFRKVIVNAMVGKGECEAVDCTIDRDQNIAAADTLNVVLKIRPNGYSSFIDIALGFEA
jgi:hypothetical protein